MNDNTSEEEKLFDSIIEEILVSDLRLKLVEHFMLWDGE